MRGPKEDPLGVAETSWCWGLVEEKSDQLVRGMGYAGLTQYQSFLGEGGHKEGGGPQGKEGGIVCRN